jgi:phosphopantetheinyl transferase (holo-ACP synthase)
MLGNDIVDLNHLPDQVRSLSKPYLNKICSDLEIDKILNSENPNLSLWRIWTMKESAYKIAMKLGAKRAFNPKKFETFLVDARSGHICSSYGTLLSETVFDENYIHTVSFLAKCKGYKSGQKICADHQSESVRQTIVEDFKMLNPVQDKAEIIMKAEIPFLSTDKGLVDISLSHHGDFIAWAFENL